MLGDDLRAVDGAAVGAWIEPALGDYGAVEDQVPKPFEAYARIFHPASDDEGNDVSWAEVARRLGRTAHPGMQWHQIVETLDRRCAVLGEQTAGLAHCYFGLCKTNHQPLVDKSVAEEGPRGTDLVPKALLRGCCIQGGSDPLRITQLEGRRRERTG